jgi:hypothetical protein
MRSLQSRAEDLERHIAKSKADNFRGSARVNLSFLSFPPLRSLEEDRLLSLKRSFEKNGCLQVDPRYSIQAVIADAELQQAARESSITLEELRASLEPPELRFNLGYHLECCKGKHRAAAAAEYLPPDRHWWVVDLYSKSKVATNV